MKAPASQALARGFSHACDEIQGYYFARPMAPAELEAMLREGRQLKRSGGGAPSEPWALLLDDSEQELLLLEEILRSDGFAVLKTTDPRHAFELLAGHPVSIVISDQNMPSMTGVEFLDHVRLEAAMRRSLASLSGVDPRISNLG